MPRYFPSYTQAELEDELKKCQQELLAGKALIGAGAGDVSSTYVLQQDVMKRMRMIQYDLYQLDPTNHPITNIHSTRAVGRFYDRITSGVNDD